MYAHLLLFEKKIQYKRSTFPNFYSIHKNNPALVASIILKKSTSTVFVRFLKNTFNFTRSCAFTQKAKFYALKMLKNKISRILKLPSWQHWINSHETRLNLFVLLTKNTQRICLAASGGHEPVTFRSLVRHLSATPHMWTSNGENVPRRGECLRG